METIGSDRTNLGKDYFPAPYRMDLALTYRCQNRCDHCYNEPRQLKELTVEQWKEVIAMTWKLGFPHVVFTGGADDIRRVSGLGGPLRGVRAGHRTGHERKEPRPPVTSALMVKGLDHVQITVLSYNAELHDGLVGEKGAWQETIEGLKVALLEDHVCEHEHDHTPIERDREVTT